MAELSNDPESHRKSIYPGFMMNRFFSDQAQCQPCGRILFVDDDINLLESQKRTFVDRYDVITASCADDALQKLGRSSDISVVVSDIRMPDTDGIALLRQISQFYPDIVRIIFTGYVNLQNAMDAVNECQAFRILSKPCSTEKMKAALDAALSQSRLIQGQRELAVLRKYQHAMEGVILGFTKLVETRDPYTAGHQRKVSNLAAIIAQEMGLGLDCVAGIRLAGLVHDIGKVYVPVEFLNKAGKLSDIEFSIIKQHPLVGHEILSPIDFSWPLSRFVLEHHERLDGSGYPYGLSGDDISIEAKILAVADTVDAMTSNRPYRPALGIEAALREIEDNQSTHYAPEAVRACLTLFCEKGFRECLE